MGVKTTLPEGYVGYVYEDASQSRRLAEEQGTDEDLFEDEEEQEPKRLWKAKSKFNAVTVWGHDSAPYDIDDAYLRGLQWISLAKAVST